MSLHDPKKMAAILGDSAIPFDDRIQIGRHLFNVDNELNRAAMEQIFQAVATAHSGELEAKKAQELAELINQIQAGPLRQGTFVEIVAGPGDVPRARVTLQDGTTAYSVMPEGNTNAESPLRCGDSVLVDGQGRIVLCRNGSNLEVGKEARLEHRVDGRRVRVTLRDFEKEIFLMSDELRCKLDAGEVVPGATLLVCEQRRMAFDALPNPDGFSHFKFLVKDPPPDVVVERDIGAPPKFIDELTEHLITEMTRPELNRRYKLRRSSMTLLTGVSGSGKTLSILGFWRRMYDVMSELTGVPIDQLPPRVVRVRPSQALSKWLGESDKLVDRFFDEIEQLAGEKWIGPDGREHELPVFAIMEECDGMARARGEDSIHDRIQTTLLQRLDVTSQRLRNQLVMLVFSTNLPHVVDPAFLRRAGGTIERFGRLGKRAFQAVLDKHLTGLPFRRNNGCDDATIQRRITAELCGWMFGPGSQQHGLVELTYVGTSHPVVKYRKDFLTGALVDRAVQQAAISARQAERDGVENPGVTAAGLIRAFDAQIRSTVDQLREGNVREHVDLPDGVRVGSVRRLEQPAVLPFELHRAS